nr:MAG TPA: hypothetical protein [Caudoviricetes sp.]
MLSLTEYRLQVYHTPLSCICQYFCCNFFIKFMLDFLYFVAYNKIII